MNVITQAFHDELEKIAALRRKVSVLIQNEDGDVLVARRGPSYDFPGGGIEEGFSINRAARQEALEEVGYKLKKVRGVGVRPHTVKWSSPVAAKIGKGGKRNFTGSKLYWRRAKISGKDMSLHNIEGDALQASFVPVKKVLEDLRRTAADPENIFADFDHAKIDALEKIADDGKPSTCSS